MSVSISCSHHLTDSWTITADQAKLQNRFQFIFQAMGELGTNVTSLTDCSDVLDIPAPLTTTPHFPAGVTINDVQQAVGAIASFL